MTGYILHFSDYSKPPLPVEIPPPPGRLPEPEPPLSPLSVCPEITALNVTDAAAVVAVAATLTEIIEVPLPTAVTSPVVELTLAIEVLLF